MIDIISEAPLFHQLIQPAEKRTFAIKMLGRVGLDQEALERYPHQFSGGQRQGWNCESIGSFTGVLVCDESIAALDVSIQAQIINLFSELKINLI